MSGQNRGYLAYRLHCPGGETFRNVAWLLRSTARGHDLAARLDRLRLIVVLSETTREQARLFTDRFLGEVRKAATGSCDAIHEEPSVPSTAPRSRP